jgi:hypothetical protein
MLPEISRRRFLRQSFAFSAAATMGRLPVPSLPARPDHAAVNFLMIGDWGREGSIDPQKLVADSMIQYTQTHELRPDALLLLGDSWYGELAGGVHSPRWQTQFESMYPASAFAGPAYSMLGNHDYQRWPGSKVDAELAYARSGKSRFTLPSKWYSFDYPSHAPLATFIVLDSNMPKAASRFALGSQLGRDFTLTPEEQAEQLAWFEQQLKRPRTTPHLIVMAHHPVYSDGPHGDHPVLVRDWDPLLRRYNVSLYLAGHDHDLQHLEFAGHPTSFCLSGGGGADLYDLKVPESVRGPYAEKVHGFSHLAVTRKDMTLSHIDGDGRVLHAFRKSADGRVSIRA